MELRPILLPNEMSDAQREEARALLAAAEEGLDHGSTRELDTLNAVTGADFDTFFIRTYWSSMGEEEVLDRIAAGAPRFVSDITREELVEIVARAMPSRPEFDGANQDYWMRLFELHVPRPDASRLIFRAPEGREAGPWNPTPEEIVDLALAYRAIQL